MEYNILAEMNSESTDQRIQEVYEKTHGDLQSIFQKRRIASIFQKLMWTIFGLYFVGVFLYLVSYFLKFDLGFVSNFFNRFEVTPENPYRQLYPYLGLFAAIYLTTFIFSHFFGKFKTLEAETFVRMTNDLFPNNEFTQVSHVETNKVMESQLFPWVELGTPVHTYGQMRSTINGIKIQVADIGFIEQNVGNKLMNTLLKIPFLNMFVILYQYVIKNIITSKSADNTHFTFRGMYSWTSFNKPLNGTTVVVPNTFATKTDRFASFKFKDEEKILLEDVRFTEHFLTYGSDQVEARYVLSAIMMEKIVELRDRFGRDIMLSFKNNQLFVAVENPNGLFSFPAGKLDSIKILEEIVNDIGAVESIVEEFELNRKRSVD